MSERGDRFRGRLYHAASAEHAALARRDLERFLTEAMESNRREGARFNPAGEFGAFYTSLDAETALREASAPAALLVFEATLGSIVDLTGDGACVHWRLDPEQLRGDDHAPCQAAGRIIRAAGHEGVRSPSARAAGENLALWWDRRRAGSWLRLAALEPAVDLAKRRDG